MQQRQHNLRALALLYNNSTEYYRSVYNKNMLFSDKDRINTCYKKDAEPCYSYLDSSARPELECIRKVMEAWFSQYPNAEKMDFLGRFKSKNDYTHISASFELYLHELMLRLGYIIKVHPSTNSGRGKSPDFLVSDGDMQFYLEAVSISEKSDDEKSSDKRIAVVNDIINDIQQNNFFVDITTISGLPKTPPQATKLKNRIERWLSDLNPDVVENEQKINPDSLPKLLFSHDGWEIEFTAIPRKREFLNEPVICAKTGEAKWLNTQEKIRDAVKKKGSDYGELDLPLIVACSFEGLGLDNTAVHQALFGQEECAFGSNRKPVMSRIPNGLWVSPNGPQYKRVSGVIIGYDIKPSTYGVRNLKLYVNPWATRGISGKILDLPHALVNGNRIIHNEGIHPRTILDLPKCFPGVE